MRDDFAMATPRDNKQRIGEYQQENMCDMSPHHLLLSMRAPNNQMSDHDRRKLVEA